MVDLPSNLYEKAALEEAADVALFKGDTFSAKAILFKGIDDAYLSDRDEYHHLALKAVSLPYYELLYTEASPELRKNAENVWGWTGELINRELEELADTYSVVNSAEGLDKTYFYEIISRCRGRITELLIFGLLARSSHDTSNCVPVPASREDDLNGTDILLLPIAGYMCEPIRIQVKTKLRDEDFIQYQPEDVVLIGLNELDKRHYGSPLRKSSLVQSFIRELDGTSTNDDTQALDVATKKIHHIIDVFQPNHTS